MPAPLHLASASLMQARADARYPACPSSYLAATNAACWKDPAPGMYALPGASARTVAASAATECGGGGTECSGGWPRPEVLPRWEFLL